MGLTNSNISYTGLVEKYIGTAYDKMVLISDNMSEMLTIAEAIEAGYFDELLKHIDDILLVIEELEAFNALYYGAHPSHPVVAGPILEGAMYFNTTENLFYAYANGQWNPAGGKVIDVHNIPITANPDNSSVVTIPFPYTPGSDNLMVFVKKTGETHPVYQYSSRVDVVNFTYHETSTTTITFPTSLDVDDIVTAIIGLPVSTVTHAIGVEIGTLVNAVTDTNLVNLPAPLSYTMGNNSLEVYADRVLQIIDIDYTETSPTSITFTETQASGVEHHYKVGAILTNAPASMNVVLQDTKPLEADHAEGTFWVHTGKGRVYVLVQDIDSKQWLAVSEENTVLYGGGIPHIPTDKPYMIYQNGTNNYPDPTAYSQGTFWLDTETMKFHLLYADADSPQWVEISSRTLDLLSELP